jgi:hypothetical protein
VGVYDVGRPIGRRPLFKLGADLGIMTASGIYPISVILKGAEVARRGALTAKIDNLWTRYVRYFGELEGWEVLVYPEQQAMLVNVPTTRWTTSLQLVMNTTTGAWTTFEGWPAMAMVRFGQRLFWGAPNGKVYRGWGEWLDDSGTAIEARAQTSYQYFGSSPGLKSLALFRAHLRHDGPATVEWGLATDFRPGSVAASEALTTSEGAWDTATWDGSAWDDSTTYTRRWHSVEGEPAHGLSLILQLTSGEAKMAWTGTDYILQRGAML